MDNNSFPFPPPIGKLPLADIKLPGCRASLLQGEEQQLLFMSFAEDTRLPEHSHEAQWGIVLAGTISLTVDGITTEYTKGDNYFIPAGTLHSGFISAGYADITYFDQKDRYDIKKTD